MALDKQLRSSVHVSENAQSSHHVSKNAQSSLQFEDTIEALDKQLRNSSRHVSENSQSSQSHHVFKNAQLEFSRHENAQTSRRVSTKRPCIAESIVTSVENKRRKLETVTNFRFWSPPICDNAPAGLPISAPISSSFHSQPQVFPSSIDVSSPPLPSFNLKATSPRPQFSHDAADDQAEFDCEDNLHNEDLFNDELDINDELDDLDFLLPSLGNNSEVPSMSPGSEPMAEPIPWHSFNLSGDKSGLMMEPTHSDDIPPTVPTPGIWNGVTCDCLSHKCNASLPSSSPLHIDDTCKILAHFNLSFHLFWRYVICNDKKGFIPLGRLSSHLFSPTSSKKPIAGRTNNKQFGTVMDHISAAFRIPKDQEALSPPLLDVQVAGVQPPIIGRKCPYCGYCGQWRSGYSAHCMAASNREKELNNEESTFHLTCADPDWRQWNTLDRVWMQALFYGGFRHADRVFIPIVNYEPPQTAGLDPTLLEENISLNASQYVVPEGPTAYPPFVNALGWGTWLKTYLQVEGGTIDSLTSLIEIPWKRTLTRTQPLSPASPNWLDFVVTTHLRPFLERYLEHANDWLDLEGNLVMRNALTKG